MAGNKFFIHQSQLIRSLKTIETAMILILCSSSLWNYYNLFLVHITGLLKALKINLSVAKVFCVGPLMSITLRYKQKKFENSVELKILSEAHLDQKL